MKKSYLSQQISLMTLVTNDLFTDEENELYLQIVATINEANKLEAANDPCADPTIIAEIKAKKKALGKKLGETIAGHAGEPRRVRLRNVLIASAFEDGKEPLGVTWKTLKITRKIAEFCSDESRTLGLQPNDITFDKIVVKWKSLDLLRQIVLDGFILPLERPDGTVDEIRMRFMTASAGQLRTDKCMFISERAWDKVCMHITCGLTWEQINAKGGINVNKLMAYLALPCSATDVCHDFKIDNCIVIDDFEAPVTGLSEFIDKDYNAEVGIHTTSIKHTDGCGMMLPSVSRSNYMIRLPWIKGLLGTFDFIRFCAVNNAAPVLTDAWGQQHNLIEENISVVFTKSQFKLWNYYESWDDYKQRFKQHRCTINYTNFEEDYIPDTTLNYQFIQTLTDFTDAEIEKLTAPVKKHLESMTYDPDTMLKILRADADSPIPYNQALAMYPELLRDRYARDSLKNIRKREILDARSGAIKVKNKRLYAIPDFYAACEYWFLGIKEPEGLLKDGEVGCLPYYHKDKVACLRSPHLYMEWTIRKVVHDPKIYEWFTTNGIYTSCKDLISKVLAFDVDGDQLNVIGDDQLISIAERNIEEYHIVPLLFDLGKAPAHQLSQEEWFNGLKRAHDYSGIGMVSNSLTRLWNKPNPDRLAAALITYYNNLVIDAAKTGFINDFSKYPAIHKRIKKATGGSGCMPWFFQFTKNGRKDDRAKRKKYLKQSDSTMDRIARSFDNVGKMKFSFSGLKPFNWQMLITDPSVPYIQKAVELFCEMDDVRNFENIISTGEDDNRNRLKSSNYDLFTTEIRSALEDEFGSLERVYPSVVKFLFAQPNSGMQHKQMFWRLFGELAVEALTKNLEVAKHCEHCGAMLPIWTEQHDCEKTAMGFYECVDCGKWCERTNGRQCRCEACNEEHRKLELMQYKHKSKAKKGGE